MGRLTHVDESGRAVMVDVGDKERTSRSATAEGFIFMNKATFDAVIEQTNKKGDVIATAKIAGIMAAKKCADLIPLCHPLMLTKVAVEIIPRPEDCSLYVTAMCKVGGQTGVEMEALTAVNVTLLTLFDMCKASDPEMHFERIRVIEKIGGKSGHWQSSHNEP
jgi:cyclic pyranopterin phosphate synthase